MEILGNVIFLCLFFDILTDCIHPSIAECRNLYFQQPIEDKALKGHVIRSVNATSDDNCMMHCYSEERCVSYNLGPVKDDFHLCELSYSDHVHHQQDLTDKEGFLYRAAQNNPCNEKPCNGFMNSTCLAGFTDKGFKCQCDLPAGQVCNDTDECATGKHQCDVNADCENTIGSYKCKCRAELTGDGFSCTGCTDANWRLLLDGNRVWATCDFQNEYLRGFWRNSSSHGHGPSVLEIGKCCKPPRSSTNNGGSCIKANWVTALDRSGWAKCPDGHFLHGFYKSTYQYLSKIEYGKCCIPPGYSTTWGHCYNHDVTSSLDDEGWSTCNDDYYLVGIYRGGCNYINCIDTFKCCRMISE